MSILSKALGGLFGGSPDPKFIDTLDPRFQRPLSDQFGGQLAQGLREGISFFPGPGNVPSVIDPAITNQFFQSAFVDPTLRQLSGPGGAISRIGASAAQRGVFFSSGREQTQADLASDVFGGLAQQFTGLVGADQDLNYQEWLRRQTFSGPNTQQMLNFLGTPMTVGFEEQPSPWPGLIGGAIGGIAGSFLGPFGVGAGAEVGRSVGNLFS